MMVDGKRWADHHEAHGVALAARRARSVEELLASGGIDAVRELAETVEMPYEVGIALATQGSALDADMLEALHGASEPVAVAALTFFESRFGQCGWELIDRLIADHAPPKQVVADLLRAIPAVDAPWRRADALGADVADEYWTRVNPLELGTPSSLAQFREVSQRLRKTGRARAAIRLICMWEHRHESSPDVAEEAAVCLEDWLQQQDLEHAVPVSRHEMSRLILNPPFWVSVVGVWRWWCGFGVVCGRVAGLGCVGARRVGAGDGCRVGDAGLLWGAWGPWWGGFSLRGPAVLAGL